VSKSLTQFPLYISFDPAQVVILDTKAGPIFRISYLSASTYSDPSEKTQDLLLPPEILSKLIYFFEHLPDTTYRGKFVFQRERFVLKFSRRKRSENRYLDLIKGRLCLRRFSFDFPLASIQVRIESLETLLAALKHLAHRISLSNP
jgi:hypothetical protein